jgi:molybdopterin-guanine dinucleotide biosynthesis protein A
MQAPSRVVTLVVLAGGPSRRFGTDKCTYIYKGARLIERVISAARQLVDEIIIAAGRNASLYQGYTTVPDSPRFSGPLAAIDAAVSVIGGEILFAPCDMPCLTLAVFEGLLEASAPAATWVLPNGRVESVLLKVRADGIKPALDVLAAYGRGRVDDIFRLSGAAFLSTDSHGLSPKHFININTLADLLCEAPELRRGVFTQDYFLRWRGSPPLLRWLAGRDLGALQEELARYIDARLLSMALHVTRDLSRAGIGYEALAGALSSAIAVRCARQQA